MNQLEKFGQKKEKLDGALDKLPGNAKVNIGFVAIVISIGLMMMSGILSLGGYVLYLFSAYMVFRGLKQSDDTKAKKRAKAALGLGAIAFVISLSTVGDMSREDADEEIAELEKNKTAVSREIIGHWTREDESVEITNESIIHKKIEFSSVKETMVPLHGVDCSSDTLCKGNTGGRFWKQENRILTNGYYELKVSGDELTITFTDGDKSSPEGAAAGDWKRAEQKPDIEEKLRKQKEEKRAKQNAENLLSQNKAFAKLAGAWVVDETKTLTKIQQKFDTEHELALDKLVIEPREFSILNGKYGWSFLTSKKTCHGKPAVAPRNESGVIEEDVFEAQTLKKNAPVLRKKMQGQLVRFEYEWKPSALKQTEKYCQESQGQEDPISVCIHPYNFKGNRFKVQLIANESSRWPLSLNSTSPKIGKRTGKLPKKYQDYVNLSKLGLSLKLEPQAAKEFLEDTNLSISITYQFTDFGFHKSCEKICKLTGKCEIKNLGLGYIKNNYQPNDHSFVKAKIVDLSIKYYDKELYGLHKIKGPKRKIARVQDTPGLITQLTLRSPRIKGNSVQADLNINYRAEKGAQSLSASSKSTSRSRYEINAAGWTKPAILTVSNDQLTVEHQGVTSYLKRASK